MRCVRFLVYFLRFRYIVQYRRKQHVFVPSRLPAAVLLFCAVVVDLSVLHRMFEVFQSTFSRVTVQFRRVLL